jgi:hypothetical protein
MTAYPPILQEISGAADTKVMKREEKGRFVSDIFLLGRREQGEGQRKGRLQAYTLPSENVPAGQPQINLYQGLFGLLPRTFGLLPLLCFNLKLKS